MDTKSLVPIKADTALEILQELPGQAAAERYKRAKASVNTKRIYQSVAKTYQKWCDAHSCDWLGVYLTRDAFADQVHRYLAMRKESGRKRNTLNLDLVVINQARVAANLEDIRKHPFIVNVLLGIRRESSLAGETVTKKKAITPEILTKMCAAQHENLWGVRNRALLCVGFACGMRRSEICNLKGEDVQVGGDLGESIVVVITHSKTDQHWVGHRQRLDPVDSPICPVSATKLWLRIRDKMGMEPSDPLFPAIRRDDRPSGPLTGNDIPPIIKTSLRRGGLDPTSFSGHSLRSGFVTTAKNNGASNAQIMAVTRHKTERMLDEYFRRDDAAASLTAVLLK